MTEPATATPAPGLTVEHTLRVRYGETDQMGVVYHGQYVTFMEIGRTEFMRAIGVPYASLEDRGFWLVIVDLSMRLRAPARYDDPVIVRTRVAKLRHTSVTFGYELLHAETRTLLCTGETRLGCLDASNRKPTAMPDDLHSLMKRCLAPDGPEGPTG